MEALPQEVTDFHRRSDVDSSHKAQHHTLGKGPHQAAPGNHSHGAGSGDLSTLPRAIFYTTVNFSDYGATDTTDGNTDEWEWSVVSPLSVGVGTVFVQNTPKNTIHITEPGIYSITWSFEPKGIRFCDIAMSLGLILNPGYAASAYSINARGGDSLYADSSTYPTSTFLYYIRQEDIDGDDAEFKLILTWINFDADNLNDAIYIEVEIQKEA